METAAGRRGLARLLPSNLQRNLIEGEEWEELYYILQRSEAKQQELKNRVRVKKRKSLGNKSGLGQG